MNADALLRRQGWKGTGYALDSHGRGIKKPLLITHKQDQLGLGQKKAAHRTDDQWWMRAFDESLKSIGTGKESTLSQVRKQGVNRGGLYGFFVKGEGLIGTISGTEESSAAEVSDTSTQLSRASTRATSTPESSIDGDMPNNKSPRKKVTVAPIPSDSTSSKKRKRGEEDIHDEQTAREAFIMKRIYRVVNKEIKKKLPESHSKAETKETKLAWQNARREARTELKKQLVVDAMMKGDLPNPKEYTNKEEALANYESDMRAKKKAEVGKKKDNEDANRDEERVARQGKAKQNRRNLDSAETPGTVVMESEDINLAHPANLLPTPKANRHPTSKEKKERKKATEAGLSIEDYKLRLEIEQNADPITAKLSKLSDHERAQYQERANLKQQSLELYVLRRIQKKAKKSASTDESKTTSTSALFFVDTDGDTDLLNVAPPPLDHANNYDGSVPGDPTTQEQIEDARSRVKGSKKKEKKIKKSRDKAGKEQKGGRIKG